MKKFELPRTPAQWLEAVMNAIFFLCGILAVGCVAVITIYMFLSGLPAIGKIGPLKFLFGTEWASTASEPKYGILPFVLSSIYGTLGASLIGVPVGLLTAVFLSKAAAPGVRNVVVTAVELLSGIPSVVFGLLGMQVLVPAVAKVFGKASGACLLSAIVVLSIMILPSIVSVCSSTMTSSTLLTVRSAVLKGTRSGVEIRPSFTCVIFMPVPPYSSCMCTVADSF
jgi:phosphate transport system permease protein